MKTGIRYFGSAIIMTAVTIAAPAFAQTCTIPQKVVNAADCSVPPGKGNKINEYKDTFHDACVNHDTCGLRIGVTKKYCDKKFLGDMSVICENLRKSGRLRKGTECLAFATIFYKYVSGDPKPGSSWYANQSQAKRSYCEPCNRSWDGHHLRAEGGKPAGGTRTSDLWKGLPDQTIDAAIGWKSDKYRYFFIGGQYYRYDLKANRVSDGYPRPNSKWGLRGKWARPDAAVYWPNRGKQGKVYFFKDNEYMRFDVKKNRMDSGYPKKISEHWKGVPRDLDAAFYSPRTLTLKKINSRDKVYFFKGNDYWRYDLKRGSVDKGYKRDTVDWWHGIWFKGLDAAVPKQSAKYPTRVYFFRDRHYKRYLTKWHCATN